MNKILRVIKPKPYVRITKSIMDELGVNKAVTAYLINKGDVMEIHVEKPEGQPEEAKISRHRNGLYEMLIPEWFAGGEAWNVQVIDKVIHVKRLING